MINCNVCNSQLSEKDLFCSDCGTKVESHVICHEQVIRPAGADKADVAEPTISTLLWRLVGVIVIVCLGFLGVWAKDEIQFRTYIYSHNYNSLQQLIMNKDVGISKKERAIDSLIAMKDTDALKTIESCLQNDGLVVDVEKLIWQHLVQEKVVLPSGISILTTSKRFADTSGIKEYYVSLMPLDSVNEAIMKAGVELVQKDATVQFAILISNSKTIIEALPEKDKANYRQISVNLETWQKDAQIVAEAPNKIEEAQKKVDDASQFINGNLNKMHSIFMAAYTVQNMQSPYGSSTGDMYNQVSNTTRAMVNNLSGGEAAKKAIMYMDIASKFGNQNTNLELGLLASEVIQKDKELKENSAVLEQTKNKYNLHWLNSDIQKCKSEINGILTSSTNGKRDTINNATLSEIGDIGSAPITFQADLLGNGQVSVVQIARNPLVRFEQEMTIQTGNARKTFMISMDYGKCYLTRVRDGKRQDIVFVLMGGNSAGFNNLIIIGCLKEGEIETIANKEQLFGNTMKEAQSARLTFTNNQLIFNYKVASVKDYTGARANIPHEDRAIGIAWNKESNKFVTNLIN